MVAVASAISVANREFHREMEKRYERKAMLMERFHTLFALSLCSQTGQQFLPKSTLDNHVCVQDNIKVCWRITVGSFY